MGLPAVYARAKKAVALGERKKTTGQSFEGLVKKRKGKAIKRRKQGKLPLAEI